MSTTYNEATSVIVKQMQPQSDPFLGFRDWASLQFLTQLNPTQSVAPHFLGGDVEHRLFIMEDLEGSQNLESLLSGKPNDALKPYLAVLACQMANLHGVSQNQEVQFENILQQLGYAATIRRTEAEQWLNSCAKLQYWFDALSYAPTTGFAESLRTIAKHYTHPDGLLALTHGDPAPSNNHLSGRRVRLIDFEYGGFRNALHDITAWNVLCPLPCDIVQLMSNRFQEELAQSFPAAVDHDYYQENWAAMCAYRGLAILTWITPEILIENQPWVEDWTMREAVLAGMSRVHDATSGICALEPVTEIAGHLTDRFRLQWPEYAADPLPQWPAFRKKMHN